MTSYALQSLLWSAAALGGGFGLVWVLLWVAEKGDSDQ